jgi:thiamine biosynthesis lipoprotein
MGMPVTVSAEEATMETVDEVFDYFSYVDGKFSTYKNSSEISKINRGLITQEQFSEDMKEIFRLCEKTKSETEGYFDILNNGKLDPSGLVKGWAVLNAANILKKSGLNDYYVDAGGDIQMHGKIWTVGIRNPFKRTENVKTLKIQNMGVATSGTYIRGQHVYDPHMPGKKITDIVSLTVIGPDILEADRFATAAFAMGKRGIEFVEKVKGLEAYMIDKNGTATLTSGFNKYVG